MRVKRSAECVMAVLGDVQHPSAEIFGLLGSFESQQLKDHVSGWVGYRLE